MRLVAGSTSVTLPVVLRNTTDSQGTTGATITDVDLQYWRHGATAAAKVDATAHGAVDDAWDDYEMIEVDATDAPGLYRVDWPDAAFAASADFVVLTVKLSGSYTEHIFVDLLPAPADVVQVSGDSTAANNLELQYDTTGLTGVTFPATQAAFTEIKGATWSSVTDTLEDIRNAAQGGGGGGGSTATITIKDTDGAGAVVAGATVYVYDSANSVRMGAGLTNASGVATINLPGDGTYKIRLYKASWTQSTNPETLTLSGDTADEYYMTEFTATPPSGSTTTTLYGTLRDANGNDLANAVVKATQSRPGYFDGTDSGISTSSVSATTNSTGYFEMTLVRGATYKMYIDEIEVDGTEITITGTTLDIKVALLGS